MPAAPSTPDSLPAGEEIFRRVGWAAAAALLLLLLCNEWYGPDIWYHLYLGGRILETHTAQPPDRLLAPPPLFVNLYWLFQLIVRGGFALAGIHGVSAILAVCWGAAFWCWLKTTGALRAGPWGLLLGALSILVCQPRFEPRPEVVSYALLALQIGWLGSWDFRQPLGRVRLAAFVASEILWVNVHGYFVLGPLLVGARLVASFFETDAGSRSSVRDGSRALWLLFGLTLAATLVTPLGVRPWTAVYDFTRTLRELRTSIQELYPPVGVHLRLWTVKLFWLDWVLVAAGMVTAAVRGLRRNLFAVLLAGAGLYLGATALRNLPLLVFFSAPVMGPILSLLPAVRRSARIFYATVAAGCVALSLWVVQGGFYESLSSLSGFGVGESAAAYPVRFVRYLQGSGFHGTLFNSSRDGGYLEFHVPEMRIYGDSRLIEPEAVRDYFAAVSDPAAFYPLQAKFGFDAALLPVDLGRDVIAALLKDPAWHLAYADLHYAFFVNLGTAAGRAAKDAGLQLYAGENLSLQRNSAPAAQWIALLALAGERRDLVVALRQLAAAPKIPSLVGEFALQYAAASDDREIAGLVRPLRKKFFARTREDQDELDRMFAQTSAL